MNGSHHFGRDESLPAPVGSTPTVGRERELALIRRVVTEVAAGAPRVLFVAGEPGIGKSRLLGEAMTAMRAAGGAAVIGRCHDERGAPPFFPWIDALTRLDAELARRTPGDVPRPTPLAPILLDADERGGLAPEQQAFRRMMALTRALEVAATLPILIAFDDLHWSDPASNQLLRFVPAHLGEAPVLITAAYRDDEALRNSELRRSIDELDRQRLSVTMHLAPVTEDATGELIAALIGHPDPALNHLVHRQAEGNPFAIEEIVRSFGDAAFGGDVAEPAAVSAMIRRRIDRLGPAARELLEAAALTGAEISIDLVSRVSGAPAAGLTPRFDEAIAAGLIETTPDQPDRAYRFRHDRIRETVAAGIAPVRKQLLHAKLADAVEASDQIGDRLERPALLLHHLARAGAWERAGLAAERLGREAMRAHAFDQAATAYDTALRLRRGHLDDIPVDLAARLLLQRGNALLAASDPAAIPVLAEAERSARDAGDPALAGRALISRGRAHARREEHAPAVIALRSAIATLTGVAGCEGDRLAAMAELIAILGTSLGEYAEAIALGEGALEQIAAAPSDPAIEAALRLELAKTLMRAGALDAGEAQLAPALSLALSAGSLDLASEVSGAIANHAYWTGRLVESERAARRRRDYAVRVGDPYALRHARSWLANIAIARGDWPAATTLIADAAADVARVDSPEPVAFLEHLSGMIALAAGQHDLAVARFEAAMNGFRQVGASALPWYLGLLAHARLVAGDQRGAIEAAHEVEEVIAGWPPGSLPVAPALAQLGIVAALQNDRAAAASLYPRLLDYAGQFHWVLVDRVLGMLAERTGAHETARKHFAAAATTAIRGGIRPEHALTMGEIAIAAIARDDSAPARAELDQALARLRALGMEGAVERLKMPTRDGAPERTPTQPAGLTKREIAVLRLVADGLTNREIGERLYISEKTVINHLTHIYTKIGIDNRAGAVSFAARQGLLPE